MMRQDPDVILVGEVRDQDTAEMAFRAAMTGHQVYHDAAHQFGGRRVSRACSTSASCPTSSPATSSASSRSAWCACCAALQGSVRPEPRRAPAARRGRRPRSIYRPVGCEQCDYQGYSGRTAILEILRMDGDLDELVARRATARELRSVAGEKGFRALVEEGIARILDGHTSIAEVARSVDLTQRFR